MSRRVVGPTTSADETHEEQRLTLALPVAREAVEDVRRVMGPDILMRTTWAGDKSTVLHVFAGQANAFLKVGRSLEAERIRLEWLASRLPVAQVMSFGSGESTDWLLLSPLEGLELANLKHTESPERIVHLLAEALHVVHATPAFDCPFGDPATGSTFVHGDPCLPNFFFDGDRLTGVIDVGAAGLGDPVADLATAVWSVQYNLGSGHAAAFLDAYGFDLSSGEFVLTVDEEGNEALRRAEETHIA